MSDPQWAQEGIAYSAEYEEWCKEMRAVKEAYAQKMKRLNAWKERLDEISLKLYADRSAWLEQQTQTAIHTARQGILDRG